jgi:hypothetical protein
MDCTWLVLQYCKANKQTNKQKPKLKFSLYVNYTEYLKFGLWGQGQLSGEHLPGMHEAWG